MSLEAIAALGASPTLGLTPTWGTTPTNGATPGIESLASATSLSFPAAVGAPSSAEGAFQPLLSALTQLNTDINAGEQGLQSVAVGDLDNLHQSMMNMEKVKLSMQLLLEVRSRALDAYQELIRMQV
jgi:flagellar hook-basal body complex protein FliE